MSCFSPSRIVRFLQLPQILAFMQQPGAIRRMCSSQSCQRSSDDMSFRRDREGHGHMPIQCSWCGQGAWACSEKGKVTSPNQVQADDMAGMPFLAPGLPPMQLEALGLSLSSHLPIPMAQSKVKGEDCLIRDCSFFRFFT